MRAAARGAALREGAQASSSCFRLASEGPVLPADPEPRTASTFRPLRIFRVRTQAGARHYRRWSPRTGGGRRERGGTRGAVGVGFGRDKTSEGRDSGGARAGFERDKGFEGGLRAGPGGD